MRVLIGSLLIKAGMAIIPSETRRIVRNLLMFHVPGALSEEEKREVIDAKAAGAFR